MERKKSQLLTLSRRKRPGVPAPLVAPRRNLPNHCGPCFLYASPGLELIVHTNRHPDFMTAAPGRRSRTAVIVEYGVGPVVAVGRDTSAAGADVVMGVAVVDGVGRVEIPVQVLVEVMLPGNGIHIRLVLRIVRVVIVLPARIARRRPGMRP